MKFTSEAFVATPNALMHIPLVEILMALDRHMDGDWGDVDEEDRQANETALIEGLRLFSVYHSADGVKFWIITEWDRSLTTVLLPEDY